MKTVCATSVLFGKEAFGALGAVTSLSPREIGRNDLQDADILAIRSTTKVSAELLDNTPVRFVGTATIGTDHMDLNYLEQRGIAWCYSPGCNANSVAEYIIASLLCLGQRHGFALEGKTLGIIGVGNVGGRVWTKARALGMRVLLNDPPRQSREGASGPAFVSLDTVLGEADIVTMHVPLTREGRFPSYHMADASFFDRMQPGAVFLNASRGAVVDTPALKAALEGDTLAHAVIDTWEGEPAYPRTLLPLVDIATPHIAGYSLEGKVGGTVMVYHAACSALGCKPEWTPEALLPRPQVPEISIDATDRDDEEVLWEIVGTVYDVLGDDAAMRATAMENDQGYAFAFDRLRKEYPVRREFPCTRVMVQGARPPLLTKLHGLGFVLADRD